jgi:sugar/nucleoside kinase (ribokinase family)
MEILVVGTVAFDAIETPFGKSDKIEGGAANYISLAASYFTPKINLVSVIGDDFPADYVQMLEERGIRTEGLQRREGEKSFFWSGKYHLDMNTRDTLTTELNVLADFKPYVPESYQNSDIIMLGNLTPSVQMDVLSQLKYKPKLVVLDTMNFWMNTAWGNLTEVLKHVDLLAINDEEARQLSGEYSLVKAARKIFSMGPSYLIIKKGEHGALLFHDQHVFFAPALPLEDVFDPTGAGDTFAGGFIGYLAYTRNLSFENMKNAIIYGSTMASFCVEEFGPKRLLTLDQDQIQERVRDFVDLVQFDFDLVNGN